MAAITMAGSDVAELDKLVSLGGEPGAAALAFSVGHASRAALGKSNEDFYGLAAPREPGAWRKGVMLALADGVSANGAGRIAAEVTVRSLLSDYHATPATWTISQALEKLLCSSNDWILAHNRTRQDRYGVVAAVSVLVASGSRFFIAHVGNTRIYRMRGSALEQLTGDHTWPRRDMQNVLRRAVGLDTHLVVDFVDGDVRAGDRFLMVSDGIWDTLGDRRIRSILDEQEVPQRTADALVSAACALQATYLGRNDTSAILATAVAAP